MGCTARVFSFGAPLRAVTETLLHHGARPSPWPPGEPDRSGFYFRVRRLAVSQRQLPQSRIAIVSARPHRRVEPVKVGSGDLNRRLCQTLPLEVRPK